MDQNSYAEVWEVGQWLSLPIERLNYVCRHKLVPRLELVDVFDQPGWPRFIEFESAVFMACAANLLECGLRPVAVRAFMDAIRQVQAGHHTRLSLPDWSDAIAGESTILVQVADGIRVRWVVWQEPTSWIDPGPPLTADNGYAPTTVISIDLGHIRNRIREGARDT